MADPTVSFEETALAHLDAVFRAAVALCGRRDLADDLTQATFLKAFERFETFKPGTRAKAWLFQILRNTWIDQLRQRRRAGTTVPLDAERVDDRPHVEPTAWSDAQDLLENFADAQVIEALTRLPEDQRLVLYLVDVEQMSHDEAAAVAGVAVGTIKSRSSRARAALRDMLAAHARDLGFVAGPRNEP